MHIAFETLSASSVPFEISREFRSPILPDEGLVSDQWDEHAEHVGFYAADELFATLRVVVGRSGKLPISEHAPLLPVAPDDIQVGRLTVDPQKVRRTTIRFVYEWVAREVFSRPCRIYVAVAEGGPVSRSRYADLGFDDTGVEYHDPRYGKSLRILVRCNGGGGDGLGA